MRAWRRASSSFCPCSSSPEIFFDSCICRTPTSLRSRAFCHSHRSIARFDALTSWMRSTSVCSLTRRWTSQSAGMLAAGTSSDCAGWQRACWQQRPFGSRCARRTTHVTSCGGCGAALQSVRAPSQIASADRLHTSECIERALLSLSLSHFTSRRRQPSRPRPPRRPPPRPGPRPPPRPRSPCQPKSSSSPPVSKPPSTRRRGGRRGGRPTSLR